MASYNVLRLALVILVHYFSVSIATSTRFSNLHALEYANSSVINKIPTLNDALNLDYLLPTSIVPLHYKLQILPILDIIGGYERFTAPGKIWITVNCVEPASSLVVHAVALRINATSIKVLNVNTSTQETILRTEYEESRHFYSIHLQNPTVLNNHYEIYIEFVNTISDTELYGMYLDSYEDETGTTNYIATTTFAAIQARRAFPCLDEPNLKATFEIIIGRQRNYHSLSNAHLLTSEPILDIPGLGGWFWDKFAVTVPMSTYLVCMIVSNLDYVEAENTGSTRPIRVYATPYLIGKGGGNYSVNLTANVLVEFERYYDLEYALQKLDSVALPHFYFSAMENWGLITYMEDALLYLAEDMTESQRYRITLVVAHEVSHQFFGNYVTCKFWTWVWLNEGFATFISHIGVELTYPELRPWEQFVVNIYQTALQHDAGRFTHPIENEPQTLEAVDGIYNRIAYDKGASIIRMLEGFLTEPVLQRGLQAYLKRMAYQGAEQDDLFQDLQEAADAAGVITIDATVKDIMDTWTKQASFPLIRVSVLSNQQLQLTQEVFLGEGTVDPDAAWWIPITIATISSEPSKTDHWMSNTEKVKQISMNTEQVIILNPGSIGYYRIIYSGQLLDKIHSQLMVNHLAFETTARTKILDDYFNLAIHNYTSVQSALRLIEFMDKEVELAVWQTTLKSYRNVTSLLKSTSEIFSHNQLLHTKIESALKTIGLEQTYQDSSSTIILRAALIKEACESNLRTCTEFAKRMTTLWKSNPMKNPIPKDILQLLSCVATNSASTSRTTIMFDNYNYDSSLLNIELLDHYSIACSSRKV